MATQPQGFMLVDTATALTPATVEALAAGVPDVLLLDIDSDHEGCRQALAQLLGAAPQIKVLLLTRLANTPLQDQALMMGACGVVDRHTVTEVLLSALQKVHQGQLWIDRNTTSRVIGEFKRSARADGAVSVPHKLHALTLREQEIVRLYASSGGDTGKVMARQLHISESTLRNHLTSIYGKLGARNARSLLAYLAQNGIDPLPPKAARPAL